MLHTDDTPHAVAMGAGLAMFVALLPIIGFQTVVAVGLAAIFRANKAVCVPIVWITNVFTAVPIYGACLWFGRIIMAAPAGQNGPDVVSELSDPPAISLFDPSTWGNVLERLASIGKELWVGCIVVGAVAAVFTYVFSRWGVASYRERRRQRLLRRSLLRAQRKEAKVVRHRESA